MLYGYPTLRNKIWNASCLWLPEIEQVQKCPNFEGIILKSGAIHFTPHHKYGTILLFSSMAQASHTLRKGIFDNYKGRFTRIASVFDEGQPTDWLKILKIDLLPDSENEVERDLHLFLERKCHHEEHRFRFMPSYVDEEATIALLDDGEQSTFQNYSGALSFEDFQLFLNHLVTLEQEATKKYNHKTITDGHSDEFVPGSDVNDLLFRCAGVKEFLQEFENAANNFLRS